MDFDDEPGVGFTEEPDDLLVFIDVVFETSEAEVDVGAEPTGEGHFGECGSEATFAEIVGAADQIGFDRLVHRLIKSPGGGWIDRRNVSALEFVDNGPVGAAEVGAGRTDLVDQVPGGFEVHRQTVSDVVDLSKCADEEGRGDRDRFSFAINLVAEFVVEAVFSADKGGLEDDGHVLAGDRRPDE